ncbi:MAG: hypothetical protein SGBAC_000046 [Bacillariaceae sp.]
MIYDEEALQRPTLEDEVNNEFAGIMRVNSSDNLRIQPNTHRAGLPEPPPSGSYRPPMKIHDLQKHKKQPPRLLHPNTPIGVTAIILGAVLTEYLDENDFNKLADDVIAKNWNYLGYEVEIVPEKDKGEFYSSLLVLFVTGIWTYFLSVFVNSSVESTHKKEL